MAGVCIFRLPERCQSGGDLNVVYFSHPSEQISGRRYCGTHNHPLDPNKINTMNTTIGRGTDH